jgi:single-strand DNA-binding protein
VATTETWRDKKSGEPKQDTQWHNVVVFDPALAEYAAANLKKGSFVRADGTLRHGSYEDTGGVKRSTSQIQIAGEGATLKLQPLTRAQNQDTVQTQAGNEPAKGPRRNDNAEGTLRGAKRGRSR